MRGSTMYALFSRLRFRGSNGPEIELREVRSQLEDTVAQEGFRALVLVRTAPDEVMILRMYDSRETLAAGFQRGFAPHLGNEFAAKPERHEGEVLVSAWTNDLGTHDT
jgi:hypothetical protein